MTSSSSSSEPPPNHPNIYHQLRSSPLEIRLLQIDSSSELSGDAISCVLSVHDLRTAPAYRCLSYVWGKPEWHPIFINGKRFHVSKNLLGFLERIRAGSRNPEGYLWIDAICINQADAGEKEVQVSAMGRVYQQAQQVIAWLGWEWDRLGDASDNGKNDNLEHEAAAEYAIEYIRALAKAFRKWTAAGNDPWPPSTLLSRYGWDDMGMYEILGIKPATTWLWRSIGVLLTRTWFQRAWIVQEASLASSLVMVCGHQVLPWDDILQVSIFLHGSGWFYRLISILGGTSAVMVPPGWQVVLFATLQYAVKHEQAPRGFGDQFNLNGVQPSIWQQNPNPANLLQDFIIKTLSFAATNPRDKIYAPRALVTAAFEDTGSEFPAVSYTDAVDKVFVEYAGYILVHSSNLDLLFYAPNSGQSVISENPWAAALPSWTPNFAGRLDNALFGIPGVRYCALSGLAKVCMWQRESAILELQGIRIDDISGFGPSLVDTYMSKDFRPLIKFCLRLGPRYSATEDSTEALWRTLIGDCDEVSCPSDPSTAKGFKMYLQLSTAIFLYGSMQESDIPPYQDWSDWKCFDDLHYSSPETTIAIPSVAELTEFAEWWRAVMTGGKERFLESKKVGPSDRYARAAGRIYDNRSLFVSQDGMIGLAPLRSQPRDQIWLLAGSRVPFILRPLEVVNTFEVVGEAYVHGHMFGEILDQRPGFSLECINLM